MNDNKNGMHPARTDAPGWSGDDPLLVLRCAAMNGCNGCLAKLRSMLLYLRGRTYDGQHATLSAFETAEEEGGASA